MDVSGLQYTPGGIEPVFHVQCNMALYLLWLAVVHVQVCDIDIKWIMDRCAGNADCAGFTYNGKCGYLKTSVGGAESRSGWTLYIKQ